MTKKLVVWGASGHSLIVTDILRIRGEHEIVGVLDDINHDMEGALFNGLRVLGGKNKLAELRQKGVDYIIFGFGNCRARLSLAEVVSEHGFQLERAIHPSAVIASGVEIGAGSVVAAGAIVNSGVRIGKNVIVNTRASVDHECIVDDGAHVCPGVTVGGSVTIGRATWVGIGSTVKDHINIGAGTMIGAGSVVVSDIPEGVLAYGVPARIQREIFAT